MKLKKEVMEKIISGKKNWVNIEGYDYEVLIDIPIPEQVMLRPYGTGAEAVSDIAYTSYEYTHGGWVYRLAVDIAKEIREKYIEERAKRSDVE